MQGYLIIGLIAFSALAPTAAMAGEPVRRHTCKVEQPQQRQQMHQQRARQPECRTQRSIPPLVDPTPVFIL